MRQETWEVIIIIGERGIIYCVPVAACRRRHRGRRRRRVIVVVVVAANCLCASACNGICSYMPCDVLTLIMRGSAFYTEGTKRGTIAEDSSQKELADRAVSLLHDLHSGVPFWVAFKGSSCRIVLT